MKTDYTDPKELRMSAEAFDWIEENMPEVKDLVMAKFAPNSTASTLGSAIIIATLTIGRSSEPFPIIIGRTYCSAHPFDQLQTFTAKVDEIRGEWVRFTRRYAMCDGSPVSSMAMRAEDFRKEYKP